MREYKLSRDGFGRLLLITSEGVTHEAVMPVCAFALTAPEEGIAIVDRRGHELWWIDRLASLPVDLQTLIREELADRECLPEILAIRAVSSYATPSRWQIDSDRGPTVLTLKSEDDIRRLGSDGLLIADSHGLHFLIRARKRLDRTSQRFLSRFL